MTLAQELALQAQWVRGQSQAIPSPCVSVCHLGADGLCQGCWRTVEEIGRWSGSSDAQKKAIWALIALRLPAG